MAGAEETGTRRHPVEDVSDALLKLWEIVNYNMEDQSEGCYPCLDERRGGQTQEDEIDGGGVAVDVAREFCEEVDVNAVYRRHSSLEGGGGGSVEVRVQAGYALAGHCAVYYL